MLADLGLNEKVDSSNMNYVLREVKKEFPEFHLFKPKRSINGLWWNDYGVNGLNSRINCMLFCAEMCKP